MKERYFEGVYKVGEVVEVDGAKWKVVEVDWLAMNLAYSKAVRVVEYEESKYETIGSFFAALLGAFAIFLSFFL